MDETRPYPLTLRKTFWQVLAVAALAAALYFVYPLALPVGLLMPLASCSLHGRGETGFAFVLPAAPAFAYLVGGGDHYLAVLLLLLPLFCLLAVVLSRRVRFSFSAETGLCVAFYLLAGLLMLSRVRAMLGAPLFSGLADYAVRQINGSLMGGSILYRLATVGYLTVPPGLRAVAGLQLGDLVWLNPLLQIELTNMLRLRLDEGLQVWLPTLLMQGSLTLGLFSALLAERGRTRKAETPKLTPLFRTLHLPRREQGYLLMVCIGTVLTSFSSQTYTSLLCTTLYATFAGVYQLLGAAVMVFLLCRRHPGRAPLYGVLAAVLYVIFPLALFVLGMADQFMHLRAASLSHQEEE